MDWGASEEHAFVTLYGYRDPIGCWWIYDEYHSTDQRSWLEILPEVRDRHAWPPDSIYHGNTYGDPSRPDMFRLCNEFGIQLAKARNDVMEGIECVRRHLKINQRTGEPMLYVNKDRCPNLARQRTPL